MDSTLLAIHIPSILKIATILVGLIIIWIIVSIPVYISAKLIAGRQASLWRSLACHSRRTNSFRNCAHDRIHNHPKSVRWLGNPSLPCLGFLPGLGSYKGSISHGLGARLWHRGALRNRCPGDICNLGASRICLQRSPDNFLCHCLIWALQIWR